MSESTLRLVENSRGDYNRFSTEYYDLYRKVIDNNDKGFEKEREELWRRVRDLTVHVNGIYLMAQSLKDELKNNDEFIDAYLSLEDLFMQTIRLQGNVLNLRDGKIGIEYLL